MYNEQQFAKDHEELGRLANYPPLNSKEAEYYADLEKAEKAIFDAIGETGEWSKVSDNPFAELRQKYQTEMAEAELYLKRYGDDFIAAREAYEKDQ
jgi:hypothetical protein